MTDTLGRVIKRVPAGTGGTSDLFADLEALDSGAAQIFLTSDVNHLGVESPFRMIASSPGFLDISRPSPTGAVTPTAPSDFDWFGRFETTPQVAAVCFGAHLVCRTVEDSTVWPDVVLRGRVEPPGTGGDKLGAILVAAPGVNTSAASVTSPSQFVATAIPNGASWVDLELRLTITRELLSTFAVRPLLGAPASGVPGDSEIVAGFVATFWASFYSTSGKCQAVALTLSLEPAP